VGLGQDDRRVGPAFRRASGLGGSRDGMPPPGPGVGRVVGDGNRTPEIDAGDVLPIRRAFDLFTDPLKPFEGSFAYFLLGQGRSRSGKGQADKERKNAAHDMLPVHGFQDGAFPFI